MHKRSTRGFSQKLPACVKTEIGESQKTTSVKMGKAIFKVFQMGIRLSAGVLALIRQVVADLAGPGCTVRLFGSRLHDVAKGGDVDLLLELPHTPPNPAGLAAQVSGRVSRAMQGRKVDVLLVAPGLMRLPIHDIALSEGVLL